MKRQFGHSFYGGSLSCLLTGPTQSAGKGYSARWQGVVTVLARAGQQEHCNQLIISLYFLLMI